MAQQAPALAEHRRRRASAVSLDLATGVNRYGPPPAVVEALRAFGAEDVATPPADAAERLEAAYAGLLGVDAGELIAGRGPAAFLRDLGRVVPRHSVAVPRPAQGPVLDAFPGRGFTRYPGEQLPSVDQVDAALDHAELVVISNPHMPAGITLDRDALADTARRHPASTLIVDESAIDFLPDPPAATLVGTDADNVVVLRTGADFYGIPATRTGVAWTRDPLLRSLLASPDSLSGLDVAVTEAALAAGDWTADIRRRLAADAGWFNGVLPILGGRPVKGAGPRLPYSCILSDTAAADAATLAAAGIAVRVFGPGHGVYPGALGLFAPLETERTVLAAALGATHAGAPVLSEAG
jgi:histidinol-phosphate/aromatic aminotransferase/cobyric acid decarboxylase-like protein